MSVVAALLKWTGLPQWGMELLAVALVCAGALTAYGAWHHKVYVAGIHAQQAADDKASQLLLQSAQKHDAAVLKRQLTVNSSLEDQYATLQSSNLALARSVADGLRSAYTAGQTRALPHPASSSSAVHATSPGRGGDAQVLPDPSPVFAACAEDDGKLKTLQAWAATAVKLFNPEAN